MEIRINRTHFMSCQQAIFSGLYLQWTNTFKHLGNSTDNSNTHDIEYNMKRSLFNGYVKNSFIIFTLLF